MIPKIFFQTSAKKPKQIYINLIKSRLNNDWKYIHFDDQQMIEFLDKNPISGLENIVDKMSELSGPHRADLFRYYFIYLHGGFFMDSDAMLYENLEKITANFDFISVDSSCHPGSIFQGILGASKGNPLIKEALFRAYDTNSDRIKSDYHLLCKQLYEIVIANKNNKIQLLNEHRPNLKGDLITDDRNKILFKHYWKEKKIRLMLADYVSLIRYYWKSENPLVHDKLTREFTNIYKTNFWQVGSGSGSTIENTKQYNQFVLDFIREKNIKSVTDLGCGDWQSSYLIYDSLQDIDYLGIDCVKILIEENNRKFPKYNFKQFNFVKELEKIRDSELYILKDVLQHLSLYQIYKLLDHLTTKKFKYILITNYGEQQIDNQDLNHYLGIGRGLHSSYLPLKKYNPIPLLDYYSDERKHICLISKN